jgi:hypothetical protein
VILIDSGASRLGAEKLAAAIRKVTKQPVRWVVNTGSQNHRFLGERLKGTQPLPAPKTLAGDSATLDRYADLPAFRHLENYGDLHRANMNRAFTEFESQ